MAIVLILICVVSLITYPLSLLIGLFSKRAKDVFSLGFIKVCMRCFLFASGAKVKYIGLENLPKNGEAVVYTANHRSFFDVISTYPVMPSLTGFIAKKEMRTWPVVGWWMRNLYCLFLDRKNNRQGVKTILEGVENVKNGVSMFIFPEGTRSHTEGHVAMFHGGSFKLATKSGAKIIPVVYNNSGAIWDDHLPWVKRATMCVEFCEPIETKDMENIQINDLANRVHDIVYERHIINGRAIGSLPEEGKE